MEMPRVALAMGLGAMLGGCAARLPTYESMEAIEAWSIVADRITGVESMRAEADATLYASDDTNMRVDAVLLMQAPHSTRIRAWKLGHAVLDLTATDDNVWFDDPSPSENQGDPELGVGPLELAEGLALLAGWSYATGIPVVAERSADAYIFECRTARGVVHCVVDGSTLLPRSISRIDEAGVEFSLELDRYRLVGETPWPHRASLRAGGRSIVLVFRDVILNEPLPAGAFVPSASAESVR
jgi:hypothetical protein